VQFSIGDMVKYYKVPYGGCPDYGIIHSINTFASHYSFAVMWFNSTTLFTYREHELLKVESND